MARWKPWQAKPSRDEFVPSKRNKHNTVKSYSGRIHRGTIVRSEIHDLDPPTPDYPVSRLIPVLHLTGHAKRRLAQRNLSNEEIGYVLLYGQTWHKAGATITFLREKDIPFADCADQRLHQLIGAIVITTDSEQVVLTAYRNRRSGLHKIKQKPDYGR